MRIFELLEDKLHYYIVSELLDGGELYEKVVQLKYFREKDAAKIIYQVLLSLSYMHARNTIHRYLSVQFKIIGISSQRTFCWSRMMMRT